MIPKKEILAVIPARGGSKGLPGKNIRLLNGNPLIAYSVEAAKQSCLVNRIVCTTDSEEIATIAQSFGAEIPFLRPSDLAGDNSTDLEAFNHLLIWLKENEDYVPDIVVQLRPTSPIRPAGFVDAGIEKLLSDSSFDSLRTVCLAPNTPFKMWFIDGADNTLEPLMSVDGIAEPYNAPRQILPQVWWQTGLLDVVKTRVITREQSMSGKKISFVKIDRDYAVDIDSLDDFVKAEKIFATGDLDCIRPI